MDMFPSRLVEARKACGLSQSELATQIGVSSIVVSRYERGKLRPRTRRIEQIATVLGCSIDRLLGRDVPSAEVA